MDGDEIKYDNMNTNYEKIKANLLAFGKKKGACVGQYQRLYKAESIEEVIAVVKDNFWWCAKYRDFADVIMANREQFAEHRIWVNQDVEIREGVGYLLTTEGEFNVKSCGTSTANVKSWGTSTANVESWGTSTANVKSYDTSTANVKSYDTSTANVKSWGTSTANVKSYDTSTANVKSWGTSTAKVNSWGTSTAKVNSWGTSTANVKSYDTSTANVESWGTSTMIIRTSTIECNVKDQSIARYVYDNRIVVADDSIKVEKAK